MAALSQGGSHFQAMGKLQFCILRFFWPPGIQYFHRLAFHEGIIMHTKKDQGIGSDERTEAEVVHDSCHPLTSPQRMSWKLFLSFYCLIPSGSQAKEAQHPPPGRNPHLTWLHGPHPASGPQARSLLLDPRVFCKSMALSLPPCYVQKGKPQQDSDLGLDLTHTGWRCHPTDFGWATPPARWLSQALGWACKQM